MPYNKYLSREQRNKGAYNSTLCHACKKPLVTLDVVTLLCGHQEHLECLKARLEKTIDRFIRESLGWHNMYFWHGGYCLFPGCFEYVKNVCDLEDKHCFFCFSEKECNAQKVAALNKACVGKQILGFRYRGVQSSGLGCLEFVLNTVES